LTFSFIFILTHHTLMLRGLQVATLGNESVSEGEDESPYFIPYAIAGLTLIACLWFLLQYGHYWFCKVVCGREDPLDIDALLAELTDEEQQQVLAMSVARNVITKEGSPGGLVNDDVDRSLSTVPTKKPSSEELAVQDAVRDVEQGVGSQTMGVPPLVGEGEKDRADSSEDASSPELRSLSTGSARSLSLAAEQSGEEDKEGSHDSKETLNQTTSHPQSIESDPLPLNHQSSQQDNEENGNSVVEETEDGNDCPICLGSYENQDRIFQSKHCSHKFHEDCILEWLQTKGRNDCPVCRADVLWKEDMVWAALEVVRNRKTTEEPDKPRKPILERLFEYDGDT